MGLQGLLGAAFLGSALQPFPFPMLVDSNLQVLFQTFSEGPGSLAAAPVIFNTYEPGEAYFVFH